MYNPHKRTHNLVCFLYWFALPSPSQQDDILTLFKLDLAMFSVLQPALQHFLMVNTRADQHFRKYFGALQAQHPF